jgi:hypothetical protein
MSLLPAFGAAYTFQKKQKTKNKKETGKTLRNNSVEVLVVVHDSLATPAAPSYLAKLFRGKLRIWLATDFNYNSNGRGCQGTMADRTAQAGKVRSKEAFCFVFFVFLFFSFLFFLSFFFAIRLPAPGGLRVSGRRRKTPERGAKCSGESLRPFLKIFLFFFY